MCGLVGVAGDLRKEHVDAFNQLLLINQLRGPHSTGVAHVPYGANQAKNVGVLKRVGPPSELFENVGYVSAVNTGKKVLIGHGRFATVGEKTRTNAHPFQFDNIVGAHNGTIDWTARKHLKYERDYGTDSEALYAELNEADPKDVLGKLWGAWALTYYTPGNNRINFIRNKERPLSFCFTDDRKVLFWASESDMLKFVLGRLGIKRQEHEHEGVKSRPIWNFPVDQHWSWEVPSVGQAFREEQVTTDVVAGVEVKPNTGPGFFHGGTTQDWEDWIDHGGWKERNRNHSSSGSTVSTTAETDVGKVHETAGSPGRNVVPFKPQTPEETRATVGPRNRIQKTYTNHVMSRHAFEVATQGKCCGWCDSELVYGESYAYSPTDFFCAECVTGSGINLNDIPKEL